VIGLLREEIRIDPKTADDHRRFLLLLPVTLQDGQIHRNRRSSFMAACVVADGSTMR
jgi:hypothetical protein